VVIAEVSVFPLGTGSPGVSEYVAATVRELEASSAPWGRWERRSMDERRDVEGCSAEDMVRSIRENP
jgi:hypothetical protein